MAEASAPAAKRATGRACKRIGVIVKTSVAAEIEQRENVFMSINRHHAPTKHLLDGREWTTLGDQNAGEWSKQKMQNVREKAGEASRVLNPGSLLDTTTRLNAFALPRAVAYGEWVSPGAHIICVAVLLSARMALGASKEAVNVKGKNKVSTAIATDRPAHTNRLAREKSPYLLQHQHNPVDWHAWGEEAFAKARKENKPIFLSIGYSTCHWCHVMERESFESEEVAKYLNEHFVSIKVDREERPDVDKIYMTFVQSTAGSGGWPLNCFLTPELKPFFGGTYFPPENRQGRPGFLQLLQHIQRLWETRQGDLTDSAADLHQRLESHTGRDATNALVLTAEVLRNAARQFKDDYDPK